MTAEQAAALDLEPWQGKLQEMTPDAGIGVMESNRRTLILAASLMYKTKRELWSGYAPMMKWLRIFSTAYQEVCRT